MFESEQAITKFVESDLATSRAVATDWLGLTRFRGIQNKKGKYWCSLPRLILGVTDWRPRLGTFETPWGAKCVPECMPPSFTFIPDSFSDVMDQRALELIDSARLSNRQILVLWSGGIDSTCVLSSFIKNLSAGDRSIVKVVLNTRSVFENNQFYINHILGKLECMHYNKLCVTPELFKKYIIVHGDPADCIQGPTVPAFWKFIQQGTHKDPWKNHIPAIIETVQPHESNPYYSEGFGKWFVEAISANLEEVAPENVFTVADWWWWTYYNFKWEFSCQRPFFFSRPDSSTSFSELELADYAKNTFFNTPTWQQWSYTNLQTLVPKGVGWDARKYHKILARDYIYDLDHNDVYYETKIKVPGAPGNVITRQTDKNMPAYYNKNWEGTYFNSPGVYEVMMDKLENF